MQKPWLARSIAIRMRDMAREAADSGAALPERYWRYLRVWVALGLVAFGSLVYVFCLIVAKPGWRLAARFASSRADVLPAAGR